MGKSGTLIINAGISRLDGTRLMKGALDNGGFGRATDFLEQDRDLESGDQIFVDGVDKTFDGMNVILISDAGPATDGNTDAEVALTLVDTDGSPAKKARKRSRTTKKSGSKRSTHK